MTSQILSIPCGPLCVPGVLSLPAQPRGLVLFLHGSGSNHQSPRNRLVAAELAKDGLATLLFDQLSPGHEPWGSHRFLAQRGIPPRHQQLLEVLDWLLTEPRLAALFPVGLFGSSSGASVALQGASSRPRQIGAVVCRGGRPDLAGEALERVIAPTLLIVGSRDPGVLALNRAACRQLRGPNWLELVEGADHLFSGAGELEQVAALSHDWFGQWLKPVVPAADGMAPAGLRLQPQESRR